MHDFSYHQLLAQQGQHNRSSYQAVGWNTVDLCSVSLQVQQIFLLHLCTGYEAHSMSYSLGIRDFFSGGKAAGGVMLTTHLLSGARPPFASCAFMACVGQYLLLPWHWITRGFTECAILLIPRRLSPITREWKMKLTNCWGLGMTGISSPSPFPMYPIQCHIWGQINFNIF